MTSSALDQDLVAEECRRCCAPSPHRMLISWVCYATKYAMTRSSPIKVNRSATPANDTHSGANQRLWRSANSIKSSMVCTPAMAWCSALAKLKATMRPKNGGHTGFSRKLSSSKKKTQLEPSGRRVAACPSTHRGHAPKRAGPFSRIRGRESPATLAWRGIGSRICFT